MISDRFTTSVLAALTLFSAIAPVRAESIVPTPATCQVVFDGKRLFRGVCEIQRYSSFRVKGTFSIARPGGKQPLYGRILRLLIEAEKPGIGRAEAQLVNSTKQRMGQALKRRGKPGCWAGKRFEICAWKKQ